LLQTKVRNKARCHQSGSGSTKRSRPAKSAFSSSAFTGVFAEGGLAHSTFQLGHTNQAVGLLRTGRDDPSADTPCGPATARYADRCSNVSEFDGKIACTTSSRLASPMPRCGHICRRYQTRGPFPSRQRLQRVGPCRLATLARQPPRPKARW